MAIGNVVGMKPFEIFKTGNHTSSQGEALAFSDADLSSIAENYDPAVHHAPIVVGHPKQDAPAYGWIDKLKIASGRLVAVPANLDTAFSELVRDGKFRKVSAAFYKPDSANNPCPGKWYLRHVGFLGAAAPAVKGLKPVEFADAESLTFADIEFAEWKPSWLVDNLGRLFRGLREHLIETTDMETADRVLPQWPIDDIVRDAVELRIEDNKANSANHFSENNPEEDISMTKEEEAAQRLAALDAREAELKAKEAAFSEAETKAKASADAAHVETIVKEGRLPVGLKPQALALFADLSDEAVTFADGDQTIATTPRQAFRDLLAKLPVQAPLGEIAKGDGPDFSDPVAASTAIKQEITAAASQGETISPADAAARIKAKG